MQFQPRPYSFSMLRRTNSAIVENVLPDCAFTGHKSERAEQRCCGCQRMCFGREVAVVPAAEASHRDLKLERVLGGRDHLLEHRVRHVLREDDGLVELVSVLARHRLLVRSLACWRVLLVLLERLRGEKSWRHHQSSPTRPFIVLPAALNSISTACLPTCSSCTWCKWTSFTMSSVAISLNRLIVHEEAQRLERQSVKPDFEAHSFPFLVAAKSPRINPGHMLFA